jgi:hypothetical protein
MNYPTAVVADPAAADPVAVVAAVAAAAAAAAASVVVEIAAGVAAVAEVAVVVAAAIYISTPLPFPRRQSSQLCRISWLSRGQIPTGP